MLEISSSEENTFRSFQKHPESKNVSTKIIQQNSCNTIYEKSESYLLKIAIKYLQYPLLSPSLQLQLK